MGRRVGTLGTPEAPSAGIRCPEAHSVEAGRGESCPVRVGNPIASSRPCLQRYQLRHGRAALTMAGQSHWRIVFTRWYVTSRHRRVAGQVLGGTGDDNSSYRGAEFSEISSCIELLSLCICTKTRTQIYTHVHTHTCTQIHRHIQIHTHKYTHTCTQIHTDTHTRGPG